METIAQTKFNGTKPHFSRHPRVLYQEAKNRLKDAVIHDMTLRYDKFKRLIKITVGSEEFYPELIRKKIMIVYIGKEFREYTVDKFIEKYSF